ncbi:MULTISPECIES: cytotoxic translational repressor of toxin-antitoxin stability system [unclassified Streptomyces]|uniref:cytotoxic translational repressor of toxin-antitoxin stability system n=1 Tax=unclassified Streptomyces TaxID=2593676 RepID=UPI00116203BA|nr:MULTISPECIES: cytotoxic translational repressor of toxin-antitoxin stability system [unclassified Streptomyces]NMI54268.1 cytotoxic translational repressor of toxin-antitoxin stability system [Streptomyces sp. RLA2-12]QDN63137.1 cytotoxic translational repressor of toxin-antitoxin stability system [Streptomyces sp. S1D4-20]QDN73189.1 cytotoxic translational repressor of toxin-antitoxin stability system [Streptomyces sp. S1D4-14]QDO55787.1 cytotoxic translational repressor of toxin-antitoxin 
MVSWPAPDRNRHQAFCEIDQWKLLRDVDHHVTYELTLIDGRILRTRVSHPVNRTTYGRALWQRILRDQLHVTEEEFWACVNNSVRPDRGAPEPPAESVPVSLAYQLIHKVGVPEEAVARMSKQEAVARMNEYWNSEH